jgi:cell division protein FtsB
MWDRNRIWKLLVFGVLLIVMLSFTACAAGVPQAQVDALNQQVTAQTQKAEALQQQLSTKVQEASGLQEQLAKTEAQVTQMQEKLGELADVTVLIGAKGPLPPPEPGPTPTALPPGATPPPRPTTPAEYDDPIDFGVYVETLATTRQSVFGYVATVSCVPSGVFKRGQRIVWRFEVFDMKAGKRLIDRDEPNIKIVLPHGEELAARFSQRAGGRVPDAPWMWNAVWDIPLDYPLGGLDYTIVITAKDGRTGTFRQPALVSETTDSRLRIVE